MARPSRLGRLRSGAALAGAVVGLSLAAYLLAPLRTNLLLLGIDRAPEGTVLGRSDSLVLTTLIPTQPYVGMLSIPRDLWVTIPEYGPNRINAAHYFAEADRPGSGPQLAMETVRVNFGVDVHYFARLQFEGLRRFVDALGGVEIELDEPTALLPAGRHTLSGERALAFVRDRAGSDDFARMARSQLFLRALLGQGLRPATWPRWVVALPALLASVDTDLPPWEWPRWAFALVRAGPAGIDGRTIARDMVNPFVTSAGAQVLAPAWERINPVLLEMFGQ
jgi:LCP family protein required for cell wall assembly